MPVKVLLGRDLRSLIVLHYGCWGRHPILKSGGFFRHSSHAKLERQTVCHAQCETVPYMTNEQKYALWSWCDPEPYEVIEVELEEKR